MKIIKSVLRIISLLAMCYTIYLMCFNVVFNAMAMSWIAFYFYYVADKIAIKTNTQEMIDYIREELKQIDDPDCSKIETQIIVTVENIIDEAEQRYK